MQRTMLRRLAPPLLLALASPGLFVSTAGAAAGTDSTALRAGVSAGGIGEHLTALQRIANRNDGNRASGTSGYDASGAYVTEKLTAAGYRVTAQPFAFPFFEELAPTTFAQTSPTPTTYTDADFAIMEYSGSGVVTDRPVQNVDLTLPPGTDANTSTSGCEATDFAGFTAGNVALIQRGTCTFDAKARNAQTAGASAVVIFNEGQPGRTEVLNGTLGGPGVTIPVLGTSYDAGAGLASTASRVSISASTRSETRHTTNYLAQTATGRTDRVVLVGAHLDSVPEGPGINDNGSGTAVVLEIAEQMAAQKVQPTNAVRFAFWGAEESGLLGAEYYVSQLSAGQRKDIALNLNFDMMGSPNYVRFVYDGDGSDTGASGPTGSATIEQVFNDYFASQNLPVEPTAFDGRSDYGPFIANGIPAGGLFSGAEGVKTEAEAAVYGGTAGQAYDPCYHQACDDRKNISTKALEELGDAAAHATLTFAQTTSAVSGTDRTSGTIGSTDADYQGHSLQR